MGPTQPYWTFFGTPAEYLWLHALVGLAFAATALGLLLLLRRKGMLRLGGGTAGAIAGAIGATAFLIVAALFPYSPVY